MVPKLYYTIHLTTQPTKHVQLSPVTAKIHMRLPDPYAPFLSRALTPAIIARFASLNCLLRRIPNPFSNTHRTSSKLNPAVSGK